jgi:hypothetical protein
MKIIRQYRTNISLKKRYFYEIAYFHKNTDSYSSSCYPQDAILKIYSTLQSCNQHNQHRMTNIDTTYFVALHIDIKI